MVGKCLTWLSRVGEVPGLIPVPFKTFFRRAFCYLYVHCWHTLKCLNGGKYDLNMTLPVLPGARTGFNTNFMGAERLHLKAAIEAFALIPYLMYTLWACLPVIKTVVLKTYNGTPRSRNGAIMGNANSSWKDAPARRHGTGLTTCANEGRFRKINAEVDFCNHLTVELFLNLVICGSHSSRTATIKRNLVKPT